MDSIGGYRLIRILGVGARADVWLGHGGTTGSGPETVAVKVYRPGTASDGINAEIEALARASDRHLLRLEDLTTAPDGLPCLILRRLSAVSLGALVSADPLPLGEAVTVLAPLALAVGELHRVGVTHGGIRPAAVLFDEEGGPVLARFGSAGLAGDFPSSPDGASLPPAQLAAEPGVAADLARLAGVCRATLGPDAGEVRAWLDQADLAHPTEPADPQAWLKELADRLFRCAEAKPVHFERWEAGHSPTRLPPRLGWDPDAMAAEVPEPAGSSPVREAFSLLHLPESFLGIVTDRLGPLLEKGPFAALKSKVRQVLAPVRKPVWIIAGIVVAAVVATVMLLPGPSSGPAPSSRPGASSATPEPLAGSHPETAPPVVVDAAVTADDPVAAAGALLAARATCLHEASVLCLDGVAQPGSAAMEAGSYRIRLIQEQGIVPEEPELVGAAISLVDRLGDSALLSADTSEGASASLLLVKTDQGWRIRDLVFADEVLTGESP
ncbi:hypothetical protein GCM10022239_22310 [Leifsonia bigeumensis]|uniref:Protein kinase domain-containing protein n=1 Tax=Leifsonella bigeumensis TaxID=433643 RepID=A0ABP7FXH3_9MICO